MREAAGRGAAGAEPEGAAGGTRRTAPARRAAVLFLSLLFVLAACKEDPYGLLPTTLALEEVVVGPDDLREGENPEGRSVVVLLVGKHYREGGVVYRPLEVRRIRSYSRAFADALRARKDRIGEVFELLSRGAVGEGWNGDLVVRGSLGPRERAIVEMENEDRAAMTEEVRIATGLPPEAREDVARAFAIARQYHLPAGISYEVRPGVWSISTGSRRYFLPDWRGRGRDAAPAPAPPPAGTPASGEVVGAPVPTPR